MQHVPPIFQSHQPNSYFLTWNTVSLSYVIFSILVTSSLLGPKMFLRTLLTYLSLCRFSNVRDQASNARTKQEAKLRPGMF
jgi:hypothetical protein